jgi:hypothetical protein
MGTRPENVWTRRRAFGLAVAAVAALAVAVAMVASNPPGAGASSRPLITVVRGVEIIPLHTEGTFTGYSTGALPGDWVAVVRHTPLSPGATITGGTLTIATKQHDAVRTLSGRFDSGTITNTNPGTGCANQTYSVVGDVTHFDGNRTGRFAVTLTHYRHAFLGACVSYFATTSGTLTIAA